MCVCECVCVCVRVCVCERVSDWVSEWLSECQWVSVCVCACACVILQWMKLKGDVEIDRDITKALIRFVFWSLVLLSAPLCVCVRVCECVRVCVNHCLPVCAFLLSLLLFFMRSAILTWRLFNVYCLHLPSKLPIQIVHFKHLYFFLLFFLTFPDLRIYRTHWALPVTGRCMGGITSSSAVYSCTVIRLSIIML